MLLHILLHWVVTFGCWFERVAWVARDLHLRCSRGLEVLLCLVLYYGKKKRKRRNCFTSFSWFCILSSRRRDVNYSLPITGFLLQNQSRRQVVMRFLVSGDNAKAWGEDCEAPGLIAGQVNSQVEIFWRIQFDEDVCRCVQSFLKDSWKFMLLDQQYNIEIRLYEE